LHLSPVATAASGAPWQCIMRAKALIVTIIYLEEHDNARTTREMVEAEGRTCFMLAGDVGDEVFCREAVAATVDRFDKLDILVNHAGEQHPVAGIEEISATQLERTFRTNCFSFFYLTRAAVAHLPRGGALLHK